MRDPAYEAAGWGSLLRAILVVAFAVAGVMLFWMFTGGPESGVP